MTELTLTHACPERAGMVVHVPRMAFRGPQGEICPVFDAPAHDTFCVYSCTGCGAPLLHASQAEFAALVGALLFIELVITEPMRVYA